MFTFAVADARPPLLSTLHSLIVHTVLISGAVWGTHEITAPPTVPTAPISLDWPITPRAPDHPNTGGLASPIPGAPVMTVPDLPRLPLLPTIEGIPTRTSPTTCISMTAIPGMPGTETGLPISATAVLSEQEVDELPELLSAGVLRYPAVLASAGMNGTVTLSFVIDQEGRVESEGIEVTAATHPGFIPAAKEAALTSRFRPARKHHEPVRVRVRQTVTFRR